MANLAADDELMILGGSGLYKHFLPLADRFYLTVVHASPEGDTLFPPVDPSDWKATYSKHVEADEKNPIPHTFLILERTDTSGTCPAERLNYADWA